MSYYFGFIGILNGINGVLEVLCSRYKLHPEMVGQEDVDIVVLLVLERNLPCVLTGGNCIGNF